MADRRAQRKTIAKASTDKNLLPDEKSDISYDILDYTFLFYGREKIGKTCLCASFPDALFILTEPGAKGLSIMQAQGRDSTPDTPTLPKDWIDIRLIVEQLEKSDRFRTIIIDTADRAYDWCLDYVCAKRGIEYPGQDSSGEEDFGKSWRAVRQEFMEITNRIIVSGRGLIFTSHFKEAEIRTKSGEKYSRTFPSMSKQARGVIDALVDNIIYAEYVKIGGKTERVLIMDGDEDLWAGFREPAKFPAVLPLRKTGGFRILQEAFESGAHGLSLASIGRARATSAAASKLLTAKAAEERRSGNAKADVKPAAKRVKKAVKRS